MDALAFTSDTALFFYGSSMLLAASSYADCQVPGVSNWLLRRGDQVSCIIVALIDGAERRWSSRKHGRCHCIEARRGREQEQAHVEGKSRS